MPDFSQLLFIVWRRVTSRPPNICESFAGKVKRHNLPCFPVKTQTNAVEPSGHAGLDKRLLYEWAVSPVTASCSSNTRFFLLPAFNSPCDTRLVHFGCARLKALAPVSSGKMTRGYNRSLNLLCNQPLLPIPAVLSLPLLSEPQRVGDGCRNEHQHRRPCDLSKTEDDADSITTYRYAQSWLFILPKDLGHDAPTLPKQK